MLYIRVHVLYIALSGCRIPLAALSYRARPSSADFLSRARRRRPRIILKIIAAIDEIELLGTR